MVLDIIKAKIDEIVEIKLDKLDLDKIGSALGGLFGKK